MRRTLTLALLALACALPASASAGTASLNGGVFSYDAGPGEQNYITIKTTSECADLGTPQCLSFSETPSYPVAPPPGCVSDAFGFLCPLPSSVVVNGGDMKDIVKDWDGPSRIDGGPGDDDLFGHGGNDRLDGGLGNDQLIGGPGDDALGGGDGDDLLEDQVGNYGVIEPVSPADSAGTDTLSGGPGSDVVWYGTRTDDLRLSVDGKANDGAGGEHDNVDPDIEQLKGGLGSDTLTGNASPNFLHGGPGRDGLRGGRGDDTLDGGPGDDSLSGESGADTVAGGSDQDVIDGGRGRDSLYGEYAVGCSNIEVCIGGADRIRARDGERDLVSCGIGTDSVEVDTFDFLRDIPGSTECERVRAGRYSASARIQSDAAEGIRYCRALLARKQAKRCVRRMVARAGARCRRLRPKRSRSSCLRAVRRIERKA